jgi:hypothetical protein
MQEKCDVKEVIVGFGYHNRNQKYKKDYFLIAFIYQLSDAR